MKSYTDIEQSRKLAKILPLNSADTFYADLLVDDKHKYVLHPLESYGFKTFKDTNERTSQRLNFIPCWSLAALVNILPQSIEFKGDDYYLRFMKEYVEYANDEISITGRCLHTTGNCNLVDACVEMILKLHKHKMLNKC